MSIKAIIAGAGGRMGKRIAQIISETGGIALSGGTEVKGSVLVGKNLGHVTGTGNNNIKISDRMEEIINNGDVVIDFTTPEATMENLKAAASNTKDMIIGTTGLSNEHLNEIKKASQNIRIVQAPNMSVGVNVLFKLVKEAAAALSDGYDIEITEAHHRFKKDAPSGTAVKIADILAKATGRDINKVGVYGRKGMTGERTDQEIGIHVIRGGDIAGDHTVTFCGMGERIQLSHVAHNRDNFARGAVKAALWLSYKKPGLYDMMDVLGLK
tara:strand:- start:3581 stop:4387 length:807 start_codon:yes stop_codon:yes gene_type:complete